MEEEPRYRLSISRRDAFHQVVVVAQDPDRLARLHLIHRHGPVIRLSVHGGDMQDRRKGTYMLLYTKRLERL